MPTIYADAQHGSDANDGLAWATAKLTLAAAVTAATENNVVYARGIFTDGCSLLAGQTLRGVGRCVVCEQVFFQQNAGAHALCVNLTFANVTGIGVYVDYPYPDAGNTTLYIRDCVFFGCKCGVCSYGGSTYRHATADVERCRFYNCIEYGILAYGVASNAIGNANIRKCTFTGSGIADICASSYGKVILTESVFGSSQVMLNIARAEYYQGKNNSFNFAAGKCIYVGVDKTSLADWRTATADDANSLDQVPGFCDGANGLLCPAPGGNLVNEPISGIETIGYPYVASALSPIVNPTIWNAATLTNCEQDASGYIVPSTGQTVWTAETDWVDLGAKLRIRQIRPRISEEDISVGSGTYVWHDYDQYTGLGNADAWLNLELKVANTVGEQSSATWVAMRYDDIWTAVQRARYYKLRLTGRTNGV